MEPLSNTLPLLSNVSQDINYQHVTKTLPYCTRLLWGTTEVVCVRCLKILQ